MKATPRFSFILLTVAWVQATVAMVGSLYFSEVLKFPPCVLCWYQRIVMYPLVLLLMTGIVRKDKNIHYYVLPLSSVGILIALYHTLLYHGVIPDTYSPCSLGVSCTTKFVELFGFITIPLLSLIAFTLITVCMLWYRKLTK